MTSEAPSARSVYRTLPIALWGGGFYLFATALTFGEVARKLSGLGLAAVYVGWVIATIPLIRAALAALIVDHRGVTVRNPWRTIKLPWTDINSFELGRYGILGCQCIIHRSDGSRIPVFGVSGATGRPQAKLTLQAQRWIDELNARLRQETGRPVTPADAYPSRV